MEPDSSRLPPDAGASRLSQHCCRVVGVGDCVNLDDNCVHSLQAPLDIRIKVNKLLGKQNLSSYMGWKGDREVGTCSA